MRWIILLVALQLTRSICHDSALLHQNAAKADTGSITIDVEILMNIWLSKDRSGCKTSLQSLKGCLTFISPLKFDPLLQQLSHGFGNFGKVLDETVVISRKSEKALNFRDHLGLYPIEYLFHLAWVNY